MDPTKEGVSLEGYLNHLDKDVASLGEALQELGACLDSVMMPEPSEPEPGGPPHDREVVPPALELVSRIRGQVLSTKRRVLGIRERLRL